jgi:hypothetical protein
MEEKFICSECGKEINLEEIREDGLPAGVAFMKEDGEVVKMCADCLIELGRKIDNGGSLLSHFETPQSS